MSEVVSQKTKLGTIKGIIKGDALIFRGIPYCISRRFESPVLIEHWENEIDGSQTETDCPQTDAFVSESEKKPFYHREFREGLDFQYAENPMVLNVVTKRNKEKMPVIIFIHGGAFLDGQLSQWPFRDSVEYANRNVVLVNISYRLNVFGYYRGNNYGLQDQLCAIEWVYRYIDDYGGDPEQIYLMGQSAGAMSIVDLLSSRKLQGKVQGAVLLSGAGYLPKRMMAQNKEEIASYWDEFDNKIGKEHLLSVDEKTLWQNWSSMKRNMKAISPCVDGDIIPASAKQIRAENLDLDIPLMIGVTSQDIGGPLFLKLAEKYAKDHYRRYTSRIYFRFFDRQLPGSIDYRSFHSSDLWYVFGNMEHSWRPFEEKDKKLKNEMIDDIAEFVSNHGFIKEGWQPYTIQQPKIRYFGDENRTTISSSRASFEMLKNMFKKLS